MVHVPLPPALSGPLCDAAAQICREDLSSRGWRTSGAIQPFPAEGQIGLRTTIRYLMFQNEGIKPYIQWWVKDRVIPLACKQGDGPHVRSGKNVGTPGYVNIPHQGRVWRDVRWRHPGLKPKRFMQSALTQAVKQERKQIQAYLMRTISGGPI